MLLSVKSLVAQSVPQLRIISAEVAADSQIEVLFTYASLDAPAPEVTLSDLRLSLNGAVFSSDSLELSTVVQPLRIAVVTEVGPAMNDASSPPNRTRLREMAVQLRELVRLAPPDTLLSLTTFDQEARVVFPLRADGGGFLNALDQLVTPRQQEENDDKPRVSTPEASPADLLVEALRLGMNTLNLSAEDPQAEAPAALLLFAAGQPGQEYDPAPLIAELEAPGFHRPLITIVALGGDQEGEFREQPGNPQGLQELATALDAAFLRLYTTDSAEIATLSMALQKRYNALLDQRLSYMLSAPFQALDNAGDYTVRLDVAGQSREASLRIADDLVLIKLQLESSLLTEKSRFSVTVQKARNPITRVEYVLNNVPLGEASSGPDFAFTFDRTVEPWRSAFPPGSYALFAAATDTSGQVYRSPVITVEVPPSSPSSPSAVVAVLANPLLWGGTVLAVAIGGGVIWYWRRPRRGNKPRPPTQRFAGGGLRGPTRRRKPASAPGLRVAIVEGDTARTLMLSSRECVIGRDPQADIPLTNEEVSWSHAILSLVQGGVVQLADLRSTNGTFVGDGRVRVNEGSPVILRAGDTFWIGPVRLVIEEVG